MEGTTQLKVYHVNTTTGTETQLDVDPGDASGDNKSRIQKIQAFWNDRDNQIIWATDCENDGVSDELVAWKLDYSVSETSPTVTELGDSGDVGEEAYAMDIFMIAGKTFVTAWAYGVIQAHIRIYRVDDSSWDLIDFITY